MISFAHDRLALVLATLCAFPAAMGSALAADNEPKQTSDEIVSYGYRPQTLSTIGSAATIITADQIATGQFSFAADALRLSPGVTIARNGAYGGFASARIRGAASGQTLIVIDGVVVNDASAPQGGFNFANLDVADIDRIEVLRGPQSLVWGADAIGGVIYIRTKAAGAPISAYAEGGSRRSARGGATFVASRDRSFFRGTVSGSRTDGVSRASSGVEADGFRSVAVSATAGASIGDNAQIRLLARASDSRADIDGFPPPLFALADTAEIEDTRDFALAAQLSHASGDVYDGAFSLSFNGVDRSASEAGVESFAAKGNRANALYWGSLKLTPALRATAGGEYERTSAKVSGVDDSASAGAVFALLAFEPDHRLSISAGARRDEFSNFKGATTSRAAAVWTLRDSQAGATRLRASWGQGFRAPTLFELKFDQFGIVPNPDLKPERASGFDAGVEQSLAGAGMIVRGTYFRQRVKDQIDFSFAGSGYFNIGRVQSEGVEAEAEIEITRGANLRAVYTFIDARDASTGARLLRVPRHGGTAMITISASDRLTLSALAIFNGREADFPAPNDSFVKIDAGASYAVSNSVELYGRIENIGDESYQDISGYGEPGRSVFGGLRVRL